MYLNYNDFNHIDCIDCIIDYNYLCKSLIETGTTLRLYDSFFKSRFKNHYLFCRIMRCDFDREILVTRRD